MNGYLKQSTASQVRTIGVFVDDVDFKTLENALSIANTDIKVKKNGAASGNKNSGGATADGSGGLYHLTWDATDTDTVGELSFSVKVAGALVVFGAYTVLEEAVYDALFAASAPGYLQPTTAGRTLTIETDGMAHADLKEWLGTAPLALTSQLVQTSVGALQSAVITATSIASDAITAAKIAADAITSAKIADGALTAAKFASGAFDAVWSVATRTLSAFSFSVTIGTNNDKTGYALSSAGVQAIWDALTSALLTVGSIGKLLVDNINATISSRSSHTAADVWAAGTRTLTAGTNIALAKGTGVTGFNDLDSAGVRTAVGLASANLDTQLGPLATGVPLTAAAVDAILDEVVEGSFTMRQFMRLFAASLGGKLSGAATTTIVIRDASDTKPRITATVDADGNRSAITLDLT